MAYTWTDYPVDVGTDNVLDEHFQEAETNLNLERDRRGLAPVDLGTLDIIDDQDVEILRQGVEEAEGPSGCPNHYAGHEETNQSNAESDYETTYNETFDSDIHSSLCQTAKYDIENSADAPICPVYNGDLQTAECPSNHSEVYSELHVFEDGANLYWDCFDKKMTIDSTNDSMVNAAEDSDVHDGYKNDHLGYAKTAVNNSVDDSQNLNDCGAFNSQVQSSEYEFDDGNYYTYYFGLDYYKFCQTVDLHQFSIDNVGEEIGVCPYHYTANYPGQCTTANNPHCPDNCAEDYFSALLENCVDHDLLVCVEFCNTDYTVMEATVGCTTVYDNYETGHQATFDREIRWDDITPNIEEE